MAPPGAVVIEQLVLEVLSVRFAQLNDIRVRGEGRAQQLDSESALRCDQRTPVANAHDQSVWEARHEIVAGLKRENRGTESLALGHRVEVASSRELEILSDVA